ncbi:unnamed protein product [Musa hybrid cultivar]
MNDKSNTYVPIGHVDQLPRGEKASAEAPRSLASVARHVGGACLHVLASPGAGTLVFASVCLVLAYKHKKSKLTASSTAAAATIPEAPQQSPPTPVTPVLYRSVSFGMLYGGENAMQRIMHAHEARLDSTKLNKAVNDLSAELTNERTDFSKLNVLAASLEMSGREKEAIKMLEAALEKSANNKEEMHEIEMLLVEMLIYEHHLLIFLKDIFEPTLFRHICKGDYVKALGYATLCGEDTSAADPRVPLYKAAIFALMGKKYRAKECYETFKEIQKNYNRLKFYKDGSTVHFVVPEFDQFMTIVNNIKKEIKDAHPTTTVASKGNQGTQQVQPGGTAVDQAKATPQAPQGGTATDQGTQQAQQGGTRQVGTRQPNQEGTATDQGTQQAQQGGTQQTKQEGTASNQGTQQAQQGGTQQTKQEGTATNQGTQQAQQGGTQQVETQQPKQERTATNHGTQQAQQEGTQQVGTQQTKQEGTATNQGAQQSKQGGTAAN